MAMKILRALPYITSSVSTRECGLVLKFMYEFWGYCINGGASLSTPGGLASPTPSNLVTNFLEGTSVLATGSNGVTVAGQNTFTSVGATFSLASHYLKYLVTWVPGSDCGDDSIYQIVGVPNSTTLEVTAGTGGTPQAGTFVPTFTSRTGINYRIVDAVLASQSASPAGYIVFQTNAALVNAGQPTSQFQVELINSFLSSMQVFFSPLGSWNGSGFGADGSVAVPPASGGNLFNLTNTSAPGFITLIGAPDFLLMHAKSSNSGTFGAVMHVEVPYRIYPQANDLAPFAVMLDGISNGINTSTTTAGYGGGFEMIGHDTATRKVRTLTRSLSGDGPLTNQTGVIGSAMPLSISYSVGTAAMLQTGRVVLSEALLSMMGVAGQYAIGRCKAKNVRFCSSNIPVGERVGESGEFLHLGNGVAWPWDNSIQGIPLLPLGT
jgi:hypothetical protein